MDRKLLALLFIMNRVDLVCNWALTVLWLVLNVILIKFPFLNRMYLLLLVLPVRVFVLLLIVNPIPLSFRIFLMFLLRVFPLKAPGWLVKEFTRILYFGLIRDFVERNML